MSTGRPTSVGAPSCYTAYSRTMALRSGCSLALSGGENLDETDEFGSGSHDVHAALSPAQACRLQGWRTEWMLGWRYANHLALVYDARLVLVTEHGCVNLMSGRGASAPSITRPVSTTGQ